MSEQLALPLIDERETARQLNVSIPTLRRWRLLRQGPPFRKLGALVRYDQREVEHWVATRPSGGAPAALSPSDSSGEYEAGQEAESATCLRPSVSHQAMRLRASTTYCKMFGVT